VRKADAGEEELKAMSCRSQSYGRTPRFAKEQELPVYYRTRELPLLGAIFKSIVPNESNEERTERCVPLPLPPRIAAEEKSGAAPRRDAGCAEPRARSASLPSRRPHGQVNGHTLPATTDA